MDEPITTQMQTLTLTPTLALINNATEFLCSVISNSLRISVKFRHLVYQANLLTT